MSNRTTPPLTNAALSAWIANVHAVHAQQSRPIEGTSDPRYIALVEEYGAEVVARRDPTELGSMYFRYLGGALLPAPPIDRPKWVESIKYTLDEFPNAMSFEYQGKGWEAGTGNPGPEAFAQLCQMFTIALADYDYYNGTVRHAGDVWDDGPVSIQFTYSEPTPNGGERWADVTIDGGWSLLTALGNVLRSMPATTQPEEMNP